VKPRIPSLVLALSVAAGPAAAQVRDAAPAAGAAGTISGVVVTDGETPRAVRRAVVTLNSSDRVVGRTTITDDMGRFVFANLPGARYMLAATKRGWVTAQYGAKAIGRPGSALQLATGARATATIRMARGAVITGTLLDQFGQPVSGANLRVLKYGYVFNAGERRLTPVAASFSNPDERGAYRIYGLAPGEYYISAVNATASFGGGRDMHLTSEVDVDEAAKAAGAGAGMPLTDVPQRNVGYTQIFYPGAVSVAQATPITIRAGEERSGIDFAVQYSPVARVEGTILSASGTPSSARVNLVVNDPNGGTVGIETIRSAQAGPDGKFTFAEVAPGPYVMSAHEVTPTNPGEPPQVFYAMTDLDVQSENVSGLSLTLIEGLTVAGRISHDGAAPAPNFASLRVMLTPAQRTSAVTVSTGGGTATADGRFTISGVSPGRYRLTLSLPPSPQSKWTVRSATLLGQDALDIPVDVRQSTNEATIAITDRIAELAGTVEAAAGASRDYTMILFSTDRALWGPQSRRTLTSRTSTDGSFIFRNVPPGDYYLAAVDDVEQGEWYDPSFLQRLASGAMRVTMAEGEKKVQTIRVGGG
jgi:Carboxypeptidase regulatory-like domain